MVYDDFKSMIKQSTPLITFYGIFELFAGLFLVGISKRMELIPGILILLPGILDMRGNISCALGSRLGSALHMGYIKPAFRFDDEMKANIFSSLILSIVMSIILAALSYWISLFMNIKNVSFALLFFISVLSSTLSGIFLTFLTVSVAIMTYRKGLDPDNITTPLLATIGDIAMVAFIAFSIEIAFMVGL